MDDENSNLFARFRPVFQAHAERPALLLPTGKSLSFEDVDRESARLACLFSDLAVERGARVTVQVEKSPQALCLYLACLRAGLVFHPLNTGYREQELTFFLGDAQPAVTVCDPSDASLFERLGAGAGVTHRFTLDAMGGGSLIDAAAGVSEEFETVCSGPDDLACLLYSSGTTGRPKGIMLTHDNLVSNAQTLVRQWGFSAEDVLLHALPIYHVHGLFVATHCALLSGARMRWLSGFDTDAVLDALPGSTVMMGVPTYYVRLLADERLDRERVNTMRLFVSGSAPLLPETFTGFEARTGQRILERYGMSETGMNTSNPLNGERKVGSVGPPLPGVNLRIVDDADQPLTADSVGRIQVRGRNVFRGYWRLEEKTAQDFSDDGYFDTGDQGRIDEDGYVYIVGREKDMVITGGLNVYPKEVELLIDSSADILESAVFGVPHSDFGEAVVAVVVPASSEQVPDEKSLIADLREKLSAYKVPKRILTLDTLPRNAMGKVLKSELREIYRDLFSGGL